MSCVRRNRSGDGWRPSCLVLKRRDPEPNSVWLEPLCGRQRGGAAPDSVHDRRGGASTELARMRFGIWTPLPHSIRPEPRMERAIKALNGGEAEEAGDASFEFAVDALQRGERHGFEVTL